MIVIHYYHVTDDIPQERLAEYRTAFLGVKRHACLVTDTQIVEYDYRPTFQQAMVDNAIPDAINVIHNSDCYFTASALEIIKTMSESYVFCVTRRDIETTEKDAVLYNQPGSQDGWCFTGKIRTDQDMSFMPGSAGCDNRLVSIFMASGYKVVNPAENVELMHIHNTGYRNWLPKVDGHLIGTYMGSWDPVGKRPIITKGLTLPPDRRRLDSARRP